MPTNDEYKYRVPRLLAAVVTFMSLIKIYSGNLG